MKTSELTGALLDYWTGRADGIPAADLAIQQVQRGVEIICVYGGMKRYNPSTAWVFGGAIIERGCFDLEYHNELMLVLGDNETWWEAYIRSDCSKVSCGPTPLIAAMRAFVGSVFGDEVPDETA